MQRTTKLLPLGLIVEGRLVVVVGGGEVATRKAEELAAVGARVRVISPTFSEELRRDVSNGSIERITRRFGPSDLDDAWLVVAATDDAATQRHVRAASDERRLFCVAVDDVDHATAWGLARIERGALFVGISTHGTAPALSRLLREVLEEVLPDEPTIEAVQALRAEWKAEKKPMGQRFFDLVERIYERRLRPPPAQ